MFLECCSVNDQSWGNTAEVWKAASHLHSDRVNERHREGWTHSKPQREEEGHDDPRRLSQLPRHHFGPVDHGQCAQVPVRNPQQTDEDHGEEVMCKENIVQVVPGLIVAEHEERNQGGSGDGQQW